MIAFTSWNVYVAGTEASVEASQEPKIASGEEFEAEVHSALSPKELIVKYAKDYDVDPDVLLAVALCESGIKQFKADGSVIHNPHDPNSGSWGIFQFQEATFFGWAKERGLDYDINSTVDQVEMTAWAFSQGRASHWSCWRKL